MKKLFKFVINSKVGKILLQALIDELILEIRRKVDLNKLVVMNDAVTEVANELKAKIQGTENKPQG